MDELDLLIDLHLEADRQGPGSEATTRCAIALAGLAGRRALRIADVGCGTGASTLVLARELDARIEAVDLLPAFLERLQLRAAAVGVAERIHAAACAMDALPFTPESLDALWSEGAIYNIGFERGVREWRRFLAAGGILAVSELTWLTAHRPAELDAHWRSQYPEVGTASEKLAVLERHGFSPRGCFVLPAECWLEGYYRPMQARFESFLRKHGHGAGSRAIVAAETLEIDLYERYGELFGYVFYVAEKRGVEASGH